MSQPTFIETPEPPSDLDTPSEMPGTPNSTTTSLSALSTTAIKDGHRGSSHAFTHAHHLSTNTLEAERADRISRLAGLERVSTIRQNSTGGTAPPQPPGYFDAAGNPVYTTKISTVGSASATGSVGHSVGGQTTTWASSSQRGGDDDTDKMSMDTNYRDIDERDRYSAMGQSEDGDGMSEEGNASLVGFGEGAGSTVSGPTYSRNSRSGLASQLQGGQTAGSPASTATGAVEQRQQAQRLGPVADESGGAYVDTTVRSPVPVQSGGQGVAERIMRERMDDGERRGPTMSTPEEAGLGKFYFEDRK